MSQTLERTDLLAVRDPERTAAVALKAFSRVTDAWRVRNADAARLLGVGERSWSRAKKGEAIRLSADGLDRVSAVVGVYKGLHFYWDEPLADRWVSLPNDGPPFLGRAPLAYMTEGGLQALLATRSYVDALRGGL